MDRKTGSSVYIMSVIIVFIMVLSGMFVAISAATTAMHNGSIGSSSQPDDKSSKNGVGGDRGVSADSKTGGRPKFTPEDHSPKKKSSPGNPVDEKPLIPRHKQQDNVREKTNPQKPIPPPLPEKPKKPVSTVTPSPPTEVMSYPAENSNSQPDYAFRTFQEKSDYEPMIIPPPTHEECIKNGDFESHDPFESWNRIENAPGTWVVSGYPAYSGVQGAFCVPSMPSAASYELYQDIKIPQYGSKAVLNFWDSCPVNGNSGWDAAPGGPMGAYYAVTIRDTSGNVLDVVFNAAGGPPTWPLYMHHTFDASNYIGKTIRIHFEFSVYVKTARIFIDDVSMTLSGDWIVDDKQTISDETLTVYGNLQVKSGGYLHISNSEVIVLGSVYVDGNLYVSATDLDPALIVITGSAEFIDTIVFCQIATIIRNTGRCWFNSSSWVADDSGWNVYFYVDGRLWVQADSVLGTESFLTSSNNNYYFIANRTSSVSVMDSVVEYCGVTPYMPWPSCMQSGFWLNTNNTIIRNSTFRYNLFAIVAYQCGIDVSGCTFHANLYGVYANPDTKTTFNDWRIVITDNIFYDNSISAVSLGDYRYMVVYPIWLNSDSKAWLNYTIIIEHNNITSPATSAMGAIFVCPYIRSQSGMGVLSGNIHLRFNDITHTGDYAVFVNIMSSSDNSAIDVRSISNANICYNNITTKNVYSAIYYSSSASYTGLDDKGSFETTSVLKLERNNIMSIQNTVNIIYADMYSTTSGINSTYNAVCSIRNNSIYSNNNNFNTAIYVSGYTNSGLTQFSRSIYNNTRIIEDNKITLNRISPFGDGLYIYDEFAPCSGLVRHNLHQSIQRNNITCTGRMMSEGIYWYLFEDIGQANFGTVISNITNDICDNWLWFFAGVNSAVYIDIDSYDYNAYKQHSVVFNAMNKIVNNKIFMFTDDGNKLGITYTYHHYVENDYDNYLYLKFNNYIYENKIVESGSSGLFSSYGIGFIYSLYPHSANFTFIETTSISTNKIDYNSPMATLFSDNCGIYYYSTASLSRYGRMKGDINSQVTINGNNIYLRNGNAYSAIGFYDNIIPNAANTTISTFRSISSNIIRIGPEHSLNGYIVSPIYVFENIGVSSVIGQKTIYRSNCDINYNSLLSNSSQMNYVINLYDYNQPHTASRESMTIRSISHNTISLGNHSEIFESVIYYYSDAYSLQNTGTAYPNWLFSSVVNINHNKINTGGYCRNAIFKSDHIQPHYGNTTNNLIRNITFNIISYLDSYWDMYSVIYSDVNPYLVYERFLSLHINYASKIDFNRIYVNKHNNFVTLIYDGCYFYPDYGTVFADVSQSISNNTFITADDVDVYSCIYYEPYIYPEEDTARIYINLVYSLNDNKIKLGNGEVDYVLYVWPYYFAGYARDFIVMNQTGKINGNIAYAESDFTYNFVYYYLESGVSVHGVEFNYVGMQNSLSIYGNKLTLNNTYLWTSSLIYVSDALYPHRGNLTSSLNINIKENELNARYGVNYPIFVYHYVRQDRAGPGQEYYAKVTGDLSIENNKIYAKISLIQINVVDEIYPTQCSIVNNLKKSIIGNVHTMDSSNGIRIYQENSAEYGSGRVNNTIQVLGNRIYGSGFKGEGITIKIDSEAVKKKSRFAVNSNVKINDNLVSHTYSGINVQIGVYNPDYGDGGMISHDIIGEIKKNAISAGEYGYYGFYSVYALNYYGFLNCSINLIENTVYMNGIGDGALLNLFEAQQNLQDASGRSYATAFVTIDNNKLYGNSTCLIGIDVETSAYVDFGSINPASIDLMLTISACDVVGFTECGVYVGSYAKSSSNNMNWAMSNINVNIQGSYIANNNYGVYLYTDASAGYHLSPARSYTNSTIQNNNPSISGNQFGIYIETYIGGYTDHGYVVAGATSNVMNNDIRYNAICGIYLYGCSATIFNNKIWQNGIGTYVDESNPISIASNTYHNNTKWAIQIWNGWKTQIRENKIINNQNGIGIMLNGRFISIVQNDIIYNFGYGVYITGKSFAALENNRISWNLDYGIWCHPSSRSEFIVNSHADCRKNDLQIYGNITVMPGGYLALYDLYVRIGSNRHNEERVLVQSGATMYADGAIFTSVQPSVYSYYFDIFGNSTMVKCGVTQAFRLVIGSNDVRIEETTVWRNFCDGIYVFGCSPVIINSYLEYNPNAGILAENSAGLMLNGNRFFGNFIGISMKNCNNVDISYCNVINSTLDGIHAQNCAVSIVKTTVSGNLRGISVLQCSELAVDGSLFAWNGDGIYSDSSVVKTSGTTIKDNHVGVVAYNHSDVKITDCILQNTDFLEMYIWQFSDITTLDTHLKGDVHCEDVSFLRVNWSVTVRVIDSTGAPVKGADVKIIDSTSRQITNRTDSDGSTPKMECTQFVQDNAGITQITPHVVEITAGSIVRSKTVQVVDVMTIVIETNRIPVITSVPPTTAKQGVTYVYPVEAYDPDGDSISYSVTSSPSSSIKISNSTGLVTWAPIGSEVGLFEITITAKDRYSNATQKFYLTVENINDAPIIGDISETKISPRYSYKGTFFVYDADIPYGDTVDVTLLNSPQGMTLNVLTTDMVNGKITAVLSWIPQYDGQYFVVIRAVDKEGSAASATFILGTAGDHKPYIGTVSVSPNEGTVSTTFTARVHDIGDFDGDPVYVRYQWQRNSGDGWKDIVQTNASYYTPTGLRKGDMLRVIATPVSTVAGSPVASQPAFIINSAPVMVSVKMIPTNPTKYSVLTAIANATDADGDSITYTYQWFRNGLKLDGATGRNLTSSFFDKGDILMVKVRAYDGEEYSEEMSSGGSEAPTQVLISNTAPRLSDDVIIPMKGCDENTDIRFSVTYTDIDGDAPASVTVRISDKTYEMKMVSGSAKTGIVYEYTTRLPSGTYKIWFEASDGEVSAERTGEKIIIVEPTQFDWMWLAVIAGIVIIAIFILVADHFIKQSQVRKFVSKSKRRSDLTEDSHGSNDSGDSEHSDDFNDDGEEGLYDDKDDSEGSDDSKDSEPEENDHNDDEFFQGKPKRGGTGTRRVRE